MNSSRSRSTEFLPYINHSMKICLSRTHFDFPHRHTPLLMSALLCVQNDQVLTFDSSLIHCHWPQTFAVRTLSLWVCTARRTGDDSIYRCSRAIVRAIVYLPYKRTLFRHAHVRMYNKMYYNFLILAG